MPKAAPGFVLRSSIGGVPPLQAPLLAASFGIGDGDLGGMLDITATHAADPPKSFPPTVQGTRRQLVASGLFASDPGPNAGLGEFPLVNFPFPGFEADNPHLYAVLEPAPAWGEPGAVIRSPRTVVVTCYRPQFPAILVAAMEAVAAAYPAIADRRIAVYFSTVPFRSSVQFAGNNPPYYFIPVGPGWNAFALPTVVTGVSLQIADAEPRPAFPRKFMPGEVFTTAPMVGGETLYISLNTSAPSPGLYFEVAHFSGVPDQLSGAGFYALSPATWWDAGGGTVLVPYINTAAYTSNAAVMTDAVARHRRLGLVFLNVNWPFTGDGLWAARQAAHAEAVGVYPAELGLSTAGCGGDAASIAAAILAQITAFFDLDA